MVSLGAAEDRKETNQMTLAAILHRRLFLGVAAFSLLAMAAAATTLATTSSHALTPTPSTAACTQQDAQADGTEAVGPDTDNADVQCGDQTGVDVPGAESTEAKEPAGADTDADQTQQGGQTQIGDQTTADGPDATAK